MRLFTAIYQATLLTLGIRKGSYGELQFLCGSLAKLELIGDRLMAPLEERLEELERELEKIPGNEGMSRPHNAAPRRGRKRPLNDDEKAELGRALSRAVNAGDFKTVKL